MGREYLCHREEEVQVQAVRAVGVVRQVDGAVRLIAAPIAGRTVAVGAHRRCLTEESEGISPQGFRRI